jgi:SsrA-binding protein
MKLIAKNKRGLHDYSIEYTVEAGIVLTGDEVKSLRKGDVSLVDSFAVIHDGEINLLNCYIAAYSHAYKKEDSARRTRKLLLHRKEINKLIGDVSRKGLTLIPISLYFSDKGYIKVEIGVAKHKKTIDKKKELREKDIKRQTSREIKMNVK